MIGRCVGMVQRKMEPDFFVAKNGNLDQIQIFKAIESIIVREVVLNDEFRFKRQICIKAQNYLIARC